MLWYTSSLLQVVVAVARSVPVYRDNGEINLRRFVDATSALAILGSRGIDSDELIRKGVAQTLKLAIAARLGRSGANPTNPLKNWKHYGAWRALFAEGGTVEQSAKNYIGAIPAGPVAQRIDNWIEKAPIEHLILWTPPRADEQPTSPSENDHDTSQWEWIVDRFTETYIDRWSLGSIKKEYEFVQGVWRPNFPTEVLEERVVTREEAAVALADRATISNEVVEPSVMHSLVQQALQLIRDDDRSAAAAIFNAARTLKPDDKAAENNYAFCILIDEPERAKIILRDLLERGAIEPAVTWANMALAHSLAGEEDEALEACAQAYNLASEGQTAYLWRRQNGNWTVNQVSPKIWVVYLGAEIEQALGLSALWSERLKGLSLQETSEDLSSKETDGEDL